MRDALLSMFLLSAFAASSAGADPLSVTAGASISFTNERHSGTNTDLYGYLEGSYANFYLGVSGDVYNDGGQDELDPYFGYRNTTAGGLSYDVSYTRYIYPYNGGDCCANVAVSLSFPLNDSLTGTLDASYYTYDETTDTYLTLDYALNDKITLTGVVGRYGNPGAADTKEWELAATYALGDETAIVVHYYDGSDYKGYFGLDLTWDTTLLGG